jgi:CubicO group peptidase (beta-lactamase class C family)
MSPHTPASDQSGLAVLLEQQRVRQRVPGLAACVVQDGCADQVLASGVADLGSGRPLVAGAPFAWYSLTKIVTAATALRLSERGALDLDAPAEALVPELAESTPAGSGWRPVTARDLLSHGAGFRDRQVHVVRWFREPRTPWPEPRAFLRAQLRRHGPRRSAPGARLAYSNLGYAVLGELLAAASGRPFRELVHEEVLEPLAMDASGFEGERVLSDRHAVGHVARWNGMGLALRLFGRGAFSAGRAGRHGRLRWRDLVFSPHGGLLGPVGDLVPLLRAFVARPELGSAQLLAPASVRAMAVPLTRSRREVCGLGWFVEPWTGGGTLLRHGGRGPGYTTEMAVLPEARRAVAVLGNGSFDARAVAAALLALPGRDPAEPLPRP